ncbi:MAG: hypothetical protein Mars2KO_18610 [Maribacter sp.]
MKNKLLLFIVMVLASCAETHTAENQKLKAAVAEHEAMAQTEAHTKTFIEGYLNDLKGPDWNTKILKYLPADSEAFLKEHTVFRESYTNYSSTIKHMAVDGQECIVWLGITANYGATYPIESGSYGDEAIAAFEPKNQELSWDEVWYFDVVDGRFGEKWGMLKDFTGILEDLEAVK